MAPTTEKKAWFMAPTRYCWCREYFINLSYTRSIPCCLWPLSVGIQLSHVSDSKAIRNDQQNDLFLQPLEYIITICSLICPVPCDHPHAPVPHEAHHPDHRTAYHLKPPILRLDRVRVCSHTLHRPIPK